MHEFEIEGAVDDGYDRHPVLYKDGAFDVEAWKARIERNDRLRTERAGQVFVGIMRNEVDWAQFNSYDPRTRKPYRIWHWQCPLYLDNLVCAYCGRDTGKSLSFIQKTGHRATNYPGGSMLLTSFDQNHVNSKAAQILNMFDKHPFLKHWRDMGAGGRSGTHPWFQRFLNGYEFNAIGASDKSDRGMESPHVQGLIVEEAQYFPDAAHRRMTHAIDDYATNVKHGAMRVYVGVNTEGRTDTVFYHKSHDPDSEFAGHVYRFPSWFNPRNYTFAQHKVFLKDHGGSIESNSFKQSVRALEGEQTFGAVPIELYRKAVEIFQEKQFELKTITINKKMLERNSDIANIIGNRFLDYPHNHEGAILSMDFGSSAPSEIGLWFKVGGIWYLWGIITLRGLQANEQCPIIDELDDIYSFDYLSIDSTAGTDAITQSMMDPNDIRYAHKDYGERMFRARFSDAITVRYEDSKPEHAGSEYKKIKIAGKDMWRVTANTHVFSIEEFIRLLSEEQIGLPEYEKMENDVLNMTAKYVNNKVIYQGGAKHLMSMIQAFVLVRHVRYELEERKARALKRDPNWREPIGVFASFSL